MDQDITIAERPRTTRGRVSNGSAMLKPLKSFDVRNFAPNYPREHAVKLIVILVKKLTIRLNLCHFSSRTSNSSG
jgi:hypothetical protein